MPSEHCSDATLVNAEVAVHVKVRNVTKFLKKKKNEESCDTCIPITPNPIQSDHNRQFTKLAKKKAEQKIDKLIGFLKHIPDETTHLTNKLRSQLWMRWAMSWIRIINPLIKKESKTTTTISKLNQPPKI